MKTNKYLITAVLLIFSLDVLAQKLTREYFTTVDKLFEIDLGMSPEGVSEKLGIEPFDFYQNLDMGELILEYRYQHKFIKEKSSKILYASNMNQGEVYYDKPSSIFMIFDKSRKLTSYYTDAGESNTASAYKWERTLLLYNKNVDCDGCRILIPPSTEESTKQNSSLNEAKRLSTPDKKAQQAVLDRIEKEERDAKLDKERQKAEAKKAKKNTEKQKAEAKKAKKNAEKQKAEAKNDAERQKAEAKKAKKEKGQVDKKAAKAKAQADKKAAKAKAKSEKKAEKAKAESEKKAKKAKAESDTQKQAENSKLDANNSKDDVNPPPIKRDFKTTNEYNRALKNYYKEKENEE